MSDNKIDYIGLKIWLNLLQNSCSTIYPWCLERNIAHHFSNSIIDWTHYDLISHASHLFHHTINISLESKTYTVSFGNKLTWPQVFGLVPVIEVELSIQEKKNIPKGLLVLNHAPTHISPNVIHIYCLNE